MTGFGKASLELGDRTITVEIRSLNSKGADISLRLSSGLRNYELELRNDLSKQLERGKIDLSIYIESNKVEGSVEINTELAKTYYEQLKNLAQVSRYNSLASFSRGCGIRTQFVFSHYY